MATTQIRPNEAESAASARPKTPEQNHPSPTDNGGPAHPTSPETNPRTPIKSPPRSKQWVGSVRKGKLYCDCVPGCRARCLTTIRGRNRGKRFWVCPKDRNDPEKCPFYIWTDDEDEAKAWLQEHKPYEEPPSTPPQPVTKDTSNPWTKASEASAKRKIISREISDRSNGEPSTRKEDNGFVLVDEADGDDEDDEAPSRWPKKARFDGKSFNNRMREAGAELPPTPDTMSKWKGKERDFEPIPIASPTPTPSRKGKGKAFEAEFITSPTPSPPRKGRESDSEPLPLASPTPSPSRKGKERAFEPEPITLPTPSPPKQAPNSPISRPMATGDLTTKVLAILRKEKIELKESTEEQIRHEIERALALKDALKDAEVKSYEKTNLRLLKRLDELENMALQLTGGLTDLTSD